MSLATGWSLKAGKRHSWGSQGNCRLIFECFLQEGSNSAGGSAHVNVASEQSKASQSRPKCLTFALRCRYNLMYRVVGTISYVTKTIRMRVLVAADFGVASFEVAAFWGRK